MKQSYCYFIVLLCLSVLFSACQTCNKPKFYKKKLENIPDEISFAKTYDGHLQGMATDYENYIFWSFTKQLVKTNLKGEALKVIDVKSHHGDLEFYEGKVYVAVNFGKFNEEPGLADSWVYIYDADNLDFLEKYPVLELVHGAGGIAIHNNQVMVVGGLPNNGKHNQNYVYEYDLNFNFKKRHELGGGFTYQGIQTACYFNKHWYFTCYGNEEKGFIPKVLKVKQSSTDVLELVECFDVDMSFGMIGLQDEQFLTSNGKLNKKAIKMNL